MKLSALFIGAIAVIALSGCAKGPSVEVDTYEEEKAIAQQAKSEKCRNVEDIYALKQSVALLVSGYESQQGKLLPVEQRIGKLEKEMGDFLSARPHQALPQIPTASAPVCDGNTSCSHPAADSLLPVIEKLDALYMEKTNALQERIDRLNEKLASLSARLGEVEGQVEKGDRNGGSRGVDVINEADKRIPKTVVVMPSQGGLEPLSLGDEKCVSGYEVCYVGVSSANVRKNPCADDNRTECAPIRVLGYADTVYVLETKEGLLDPTAIWFKIAGGGWVRDYTLRELSPSSPLNTFVSSAPLDVISNPFNGDVSATIKAGEKVEVSGCSMGWCKLYQKPGYVQQSITGTAINKENK